ncbi:hypothetical protein [Lysinibacillus telephonicus]|uniref:Uncharacterized protein n=1 Tax=Lysinibacillus telephonicus TaxID=1714840 RepID=A0A431UEC2_9BACI|nr:hypothetical protein [Lysinibacillus telephonicus]RTQ87439.1 hypothetical protein EKG35_19130 [Lysinibacillus telephonicus]
MYKEITVDRSLLYIEQHHVDTFQSIAKKLDEYSYLVKEGAISKEDAWIIAFNAWLMLLPDEYHIIQSVDKMIYYSANFLIYNAVKKDVHFQNLKYRKDATPELFYLSSIYIATGINEWILLVLKKYNLIEMLNRLKKSKYFDAHKRTEKEIEMFIVDQAKFVKAAVMELSTNSLSETIKKCCDDAYFLYKEKFLKSKS